MEYLEVLKRLAAGILDYIILYGIFFGAVIVYGLFGFVPDYSGAESFIAFGIVMLPHGMFGDIITYPESKRIGFLMIYVVIFITEVMYYTLMEIITKKGTIGNMIMGGRVRCSYGIHEKPSILTILIRSSIKALSRYLFFLPCITVFFTEQNQTLYDIVAGTVVVEKESN